MDAFDKLGLALELHRQWRADPQRGDPQELLDNHPDLRELLEPLFSEHTVAFTRDENRASASNRPGLDQLGDFRVVREIGRGGMGVVYEARQISLDRVVALKVLSGLGTGPKAVARFKLEANTVAQLRHDHIIRVVGVGSQDDIHYFAMEYVEGVSLDRVLKSLAGTAGAQLDGSALASAMARAVRTAARPADPLPPRDGPSTGSGRSYIRTVVDLATQVADALQHAHEHNVLHRDVKPANILLRTDGSAVLSDFGLARQQDLPSLSQTGEFLGTPYYVSPEQAARRPQEIDHRTDIFSLGVTLYELLTLRRPFEGDSSGAVLDQILRREPTDPQKINPQLAPDLAAIVLKALEKDKHRRYQSASELADDLRAFLAYRPVQARRASTRARLQRWVRREPWKAAAAGTGIATLVVIAILTAWFLGSLQVALDRFELLRNAVRLRQVDAAQKKIYPSWPEQSDALSAWLEQEAGPLAAELPRLQGTLSSLSSESLPYTEADAQADRDSHPLAEELAVAIATRDRMLDVIAAEGAATDAQRENLGGYERRVAELEPQVHARRTWRFSDPANQFLHEQLTALVADLQHFAHSPDGAMADVRERLAWSRTIERASIVDAEAAWRQAIDSIAADPVYRRLVLQPQMGLVPLGRNPITGLQEFLHLRSHAEGTPWPTLDPETGALDMSGETGIVFILVPGGTFTMGAQKSDPEKSLYDPTADDDESPPHGVRLDPYFLSRYEMTQGQWMRLARGDNPSLYRAGRPTRLSVPVTLRNPVETVTWTESLEILDQNGLVLPTEAQWEYAARAGTKTPWSSGPDSSDLEGYGNLLDVTGGRYFLDRQGAEPFDDGHAFHAPVGSFKPNPWGFYDMHGNVWEMCLDTIALYQRPVADGNGLRQEQVGDVDYRVWRGGCFMNPAFYVRSSERYGGQPFQRSETVGLRPAREVRGM